MSSNIASPERRLEIIQGYRELADWLEAHPEVPIQPYQYGISVYTANWTDTGLEKIIKTSPQHVAKWMKGGRKVHKSSNFGSYSLRVEFPGDLDFTIYFGQGEVCKPKATITVNKVETRCTDPERAEELRAELAALDEDVIVGTETKVTEWACPPSLLKAA